MSRDESVYKTIIPVIKELTSEKLPAISVLSNTCAVIYEKFDKISWAGFYILEGDTLYLGPFQGKPACTEININNGVCGKAARERKTVIVDDVETFPGHIACDSESRSEIVVPVVSGENLIGVLDIDSRIYSSFGNTDRIYLEDIAGILSEYSGIINFRII